MTTEAQARARLTAMLSPDSEPVLTEAEQLLLLDHGATVDRYGNAPDAYRAWAPGTVYVLGDLITPRTRNGSYYTVTDAGTSGATEPTWPTAAGSSVTLDSVTYERTGASSWEQTWDLRRAAAEGWRWKAGKAAEKYDFSSDVHSLKRDQLHEHCLEMVALYEKGTIGSVALTHGHMWDPVIGNLNGGT